MYLEINRWDLLLGIQKIGLTQKVRTHGVYLNEHMNPDDQLQNISKYLRLLMNFVNFARFYHGMRNFEYKMLYFNDI